MLRQSSAVAVLMTVLVGAKRTPAVEPAAPDLIPEAREVLNYLESIYGKKTLIGQDKFLDANPEIMAKDGTAAAKVPAADGLLSFVAEMERIPDMDVRGNAHQWTDAEKAKFADAMRLAADEWKRRIPEIKPQLTAEKVRSLSRWAKPQMEQYKAVPALDKVTLQPVGSDAQQEKLVLEGTIDTLPSHSPVVTRWLKVYLLYDLRGKSATRIAITIRGEVLE